MAEKEKDRIAFLRGASAPNSDSEHPILELSDEDLRIVIGGTQNPTSVGSGSYNDSSGFCCDGTKVCCR